MRYLIMLVLLLSPTLALAQDYQKRGYSQQGGGEVVCESNRGGYKECLTGFSQPPQITQQLSDSDCREGDSWGHRQGMVWVSRGCRAVFAESRGGYGWGSDRGQVVCESRDRQQVRCRKSFNGPAVVIEQLSNTRCLEGSNWGQDHRGIWVTGGCRAVFAEGYRQSGGHWGGGQQSFVVECESRDNSYRRCNWNVGAGVPYLIDQYSSNPCVRNRSWGYDMQQGYVWVDQGCRAQFGGR